MAKPPTQRKRNKRRNARVLLSMSGRGMKDSWVTFKLPAWLVVFVAVGVFLIGITVIASPELAAKLAALLMQLMQLSATQKQ